MSSFLGYQVVEECCGAILDIVYKQSGEEFTETYLEEFSENPTAFCFNLFPDRLIKILTKAQENILKTGEQVSRAVEKASNLKRE